MHVYEMGVINMLNAERFKKQIKQTKDYIKELEEVENCKGDVW